MTDLQHISVPLVDPTTGKATTVFYRYLRGLKRNVDDVGDDEQPATSDSLIFVLQSQLEELQGSFEDLISSNYLAPLDRLQGDFEALQQLILSKSLAPSKDDIVPISSNTISAGSKVYICTAALTLTLTDKPSDNELVKVKATNGQVIIDANGKTIDGESTYTIVVDYECVNCLYAATTDEWLII